MPAPKTALEGIRVLDLGRYQSGPRCALVLARLGAEVIKVEKPGGDESREGTPHVRGQSAYWVQYNSGKKSLTLNLRNPQAKAILQELVKVSDILIQNFRPGTIDEMGFGYPVLRELNPRIIMVNISAYGQYGPYRDRLGYDPIGQAISGHMSITGFPDGQPTKTFFPVIDRITALHATIGALAALRERELSGEGQCIDVCLADSGFSMTEIPITWYLGTGNVPQRRGNRGGTPPNNTFQCSDGWVFITGSNRKIWSRLCQLIGKPEWVDDPRFTTRQDREDHIELIEPAINQWLSTRTVDEAVRIMGEVGIPIDRVNDIPAAAREPQLWERELLVEVPDPVAGKIHVSGKYIKLSRSETVVGSPPTPGQHTQDVLCGLLGYTQAQVDDLREAGVI